MKNESKEKETVAVKPNIDLPEEIIFNYIKNPLYRSIHADGAHGGVGPKGKFVLTLFSERAAIPKQTSYKLTEEGSLGEEDPSKRVTQNGLIREIEITAYMDIEIAISIADWIYKRVGKFEMLQKEHGDDSNES
ncbi:hypothetical protein K9N50_01915 [bacterium]|nr:hypothetical protein [bacterium]